MSALLDAYARRVGSENYRKQGNGYNGPCPFCGGSEKRSDRFMVWPEKGFGPQEHVGETCAAHNITGVWNCRQCGKSGDTIAFLMDVEGMTFPQACGELGIVPKKYRSVPRGTPQPPKEANRSHSPKDWPIIAEDPVKWREYAEKLHMQSREDIQKTPWALAWLAARGIDSEAVERYGIGYLPGEGDKSGRIRPRKSLGLAPKPQKGKADKKYIFIPRGIVIPHFDQAGRILRLRIRRHKPDYAEWGEKYMVLEGSSSQPMLLEAEGPAHLCAYVTIEAEMDAILIHHITRRRVGAFAALMNLGKPDAYQHDILQAAVVNLIALDFDPRKVTRPDGAEVMETPGGQGWLWWQDHYANAKRWPTPTGKDPGDAFTNGVDIVEWLQLGVPPSIDLRKSQEPRRDSISQSNVSCEDNSQNGPVEPFCAGLNEGGGGACEEGVFPSRMQSRGENGPKLPEYILLEHIPQEVLALWDLWRQVPGFTVKKRDDGFAFGWDTAWAQSCQENYSMMGKLQDMILEEKWPWEWVFNVHKSASVNVDNLFFVYP